MKESALSDAPARILVVEDEDKIADIEVKYLQNAGYETHLIRSGLGVLDWVKSNHPDMIVLDLMLPGIDGLDLCREIRKHSNVPIIMVTARVEEIDRLLGLELGADDYLCKPFSPRELVARVKSILRRTSASEWRDTGQSPFSVDDGSLSITAAGVRLDLTVREYRLLKTLIEQPGRVFSRDQLLERTNEHDEEVFDRVIDTHIKNIRRKLKQADVEQVVIRSVYGVGYKLELQ